MKNIVRCWGRCLLFSGILLASIADHGRGDDSLANQNFPFKSLNQWLEVVYKNVPEVFQEATEYDVNLLNLYQFIQNNLKYVESVDNRQHRQGLDAISVYARSGYDNSKKDQMKPLLRIVEVPPWLGVLRGLVGVDCSTQYSAMVSMFPAERVYLIYGAAGELFGYIGMTEGLGIDYKKTVLLHDFSAPEMSQKQVDLVLDVLSKVYRLAIGSKQLLKSNLNYKHIRERLHHFVQSKNYVQESFVPDDSSVRDQLLKKLGYQSSFDSTLVMREVHASSIEQTSAVDSRWESGGVRTIEDRDYVILTEPGSFDASGQKLEDSDFVLIALEIYNRFFKQSSIYKLNKALKITESPQPIQASVVAIPKEITKKNNQSVFVELGLLLAANNLDRLGRDYSVLRDVVESYLKILGVDPAKFWKYHRAMMYELALHTEASDRLELNDRKIVLEAYHSAVVKRKIWDYLFSSDGQLSVTTRRNFLIMNEWEGFDEIVMDLLRDDSYSIEVLNEMISTIDITRHLTKHRRKLKKMMKSPLISKELRRILEKIENGSSGCGGQIFY